jgi:tRNA-splicing ligase RtcB
VYKLADKIVTFLDPASIEPTAKQQIFNTASLPFIFHHVAVMPDCHYGKGATVGTVIATKGAVVPAAVGVDIGCGMVAVKTSLKEGDLKDLHAIRQSIERRVPMSAGKCNSKLTASAAVRNKSLKALAQGKNYAQLSEWEMQLGTLGGGNHFIEVCVDEGGSIWATVHSGSRGIGNKLGNKHIKIAQLLMKKRNIDLPDRDLAYLPEGTREFDEYIFDLHWAQEFARLNRDEMIDRVMAELGELGTAAGRHGNDIEIDRVSCHHNFTQIENHFHQDVWVTRKGAIEARRGMKGMIPGSMGTASYIVEGLENPMSFHSAPHGAGRRFSRGEARRRFKMDDFDAAMAGIEHRRSPGLLDELPGAYKSIDEVIQNAKELVTVKHTLRQIINMKGD